MADNPERDKDLEKQVYRTTGVAPNPMSPIQSSRVPFTLTSTRRMHINGLVDDPKTLLYRPNDSAFVMAGPTTITDERTLVNKYTSVFKPILDAIKDGYDYTIGAIEAENDFLEAEDNAARAREAGAPALPADWFSGVSSTAKDIESGKYSAKPQEQDVSNTDDHPSKPAFIYMSVNPTSVQFTIPKRIIRRPLRNGAAVIHFSDDKGRNNDLLCVSMSGCTGYINLRGATGGRANINAEAYDANAAENPAHKLMVFHQLLSLANEPMYYRRKDVKTGLMRWWPNKMIIMFASKVFPSGISLTGYFNEVPTWEETAHQPNMIEYRLGFTVEHTWPDLPQIQTNIAQALAGFDAGPIELGLNAVLASVY